MNIFPILHLGHVRLKTLPIQLMAQNSKRLLVIGCQKLDRFYLSRF